MPNKKLHNLDLGKVSEKFISDTFKNPFLKERIQRIFSSIEESSLLGISIRNHKNIDECIQTVYDQYLDNPMLVCDIVGYETIGLIKEYLSKPISIECSIRGNWDTRCFWLNEERLYPNKSQELINHSPDGFNWGYNGSGPAQLALAICLKLYRSDDSALAVYQRFKEYYVSAFPKHNFFINGIKFKPFEEWFTDKMFPVKPKKQQNDTIAD